MAQAKRPASPDLARVRFGRIVARVIDDGLTRGMSLKEIAEAAGVGKSTLYRWRDGEVLPKVPELRRFCEGTGVPIADAYAALGWSEVEPLRTETKPFIDDPELRALYRKLNDPMVSLGEKRAIRAMIRAWVGLIEESPES